MGFILKVLSSITMVLPLSGLWMTILLFLEKCHKALNSDAVKFSDGLLSLEKLSYEDKAVSSNLQSMTKYYGNFTNYVLKSPFLLIQCCEPIT